MIFTNYQPNKQRSTNWLQKTSNAASGVLINLGPTAKKQVPKATSKPYSNLNSQFIENLEKVSTNIDITKAEPIYLKGINGIKEKDLKFRTAINADE